MTTTPTARPMDGMLVLDFTTLIAGPLCGVICADLGAEVIKVEPPTGEASRTYFTADPNVKFNAMTMAYNRGKKSLAVDLTDEHQLSVVRRIAQQADVILEAFRPSVMAKFGLDYETLREHNPTVVYVSISGFGHDGPDRDRPGLDTALQAESGLMHITGEPEDLPQRVGTQIIDISTGHIAAQATLAALLNRERHGVGDHVYLNLLDTAISLQTHNFTEFLTTGLPQTRSGSRPLRITPSGAYETADGQMSFSVNSPRHWTGFAKALDAPQLLTDPKYTDQAARVAHRAELIDLVQRTIKSKPTAYWVERFTDASIPHGVVRDYASIEHWPQFIANELGIEVDRDSERTRTVRTPARYTTFSMAPSAGAPRTGADNAELMQRFGDS